MAIPIASKDSIEMRLFSLYNNQQYYTAFDSGFKGFFAQKMKKILAIRRQNGKRTDMQNTSVRFHKRGWKEER
jgi:hypothetical protein